MIFPKRVTELANAREGNRVAHAREMGEGSRRRALANGGPADLPGVETTVFRNAGRVCPRGLAQAEPIVKKQVVEKRAENGIMSDLVVRMTNHT